MQYTERCLTCGARLEPLQWSGNSGNTYANSLNLVFLPGYGELIDGTQSVNFCMCEKCANRVFELFPGFKENLERLADEPIIPHDATTEEQRHLRSVK